MYELYYSPSTASFAVHWMLIELELPHVLRLVDLKSGAHKSAEYLRLNPAGVVPTLVIDGKPYGECAALLLTLADRHPHRELAPAPGSAERAAYYQWAFFCANTLQPAFRHWYYPEEAAGAEHAQVAQAHARLRLEAGFARVAQVLEAGGPYLLGERLRAVDLLLTMLMRWSRNLPRPATEWPAIARYVERMRALPSFKLVNVREGLTDWP